MVFIAVLLGLANVWLFYYISKRLPRKPITYPRSHPSVQTMQYIDLKQLMKYNGVNDSKMYIAIKGKIYDVTKAKDFYGPGNFNIYV
jgi:membrane-associated progesterone receptor component